MKFQLLSNKEVSDILLDIDWNEKVTVCKSANDIKSIHKSIFSRQLIQEYLYIKEFYSCQIENKEFNLKTFLKNIFDKTDSQDDSENDLKEIKLDLFAKYTSFNLMTGLSESIEFGLTHGKGYLNDNSINDDEERYVKWLLDNVELDVYFDKPSEINELFAYSQIRTKDFFKTELIDYSFKVPKGFSKSKNQYELTRSMLSNETELCHIIDLEKKINQIFNT